MHRIEKMELVRRFVLVEYFIGVLYFRYLTQLLYKT